MRVLVLSCSALLSGAIVLVTGCADSSSTGPASWMARNTGWETMRSQKMRGRSPERSRREMFPARPPPVMWAMPRTGNRSTSSMMVRT